MQLVTVYTIVYLRPINTRNQEVIPQYLYTLNVVSSLLNQARLRTAAIKQPWKSQVHTAMPV